ncbi:MAG: substrate-binding domain-containing protein [Phycisphaerae bacterium]|nr:substrate-binding domain-containing protein [Phycisphaerae bacterium]
MNNTRQRYGLTLILLSAAALAGCKDSESAKAKYTIGFSQCTVKEPWRVLFNERLESAARQNPDVKLTTLDADDKTEEQVAQMKTFIRQRVDAILISPKESAGLTRVVEEATDAGIPVIVLDRNVNTEKYASFIGGDNKAIGAAAGRYVVEQLGGAGQAKGIVYEICGGLASTPAQERRDGFHEVVEKEAGIQIVGGLDGDWKKDSAQTIMQDALKTNPNIDVVYAHNDPMAHGAYLAAKAADRAGQIKFVGIDGNPDEGQRWVRTGELTATFLYPTPGEKGLEVALDILAGKDVEKHISLPTRLFTKDNVADGGELIE